MSIMTSYLAV